MFSTKTILIVCALLFVANAQLIEGSGEGERGQFGGGFGGRPHRHGQGGFGGNQFGGNQFGPQPGWGGQGGQFQGQNEQNFLFRQIGQMLNPNLNYGVCVCVCMCACVCVRTKHSPLTDQFTCGQNCGTHFNRCSAEVYGCAADPFNFQCVLCMGAVGWPNCRYCITPYSFLGPNYQGGFQG
jgi:hypothetical protein